MVKKFFLKSKKKYFLAIIMAIAVWLRFYGLDSVPPSASLDEASIGYNAYSILKTGVDEYGSKFPILLRAFDDWRPALYVYLVIPFVQILGLNILAVRLPSIILSITTIIATYFLAKELFRKSPLKLEIARPACPEERRERGRRGNLEFEIPEVATLLLAVSPWHIYISRLGHEANAGLAFLVLGATCFVYKKFYPAALFFSLSFMSYQSEKVVAPLLLLFLVFIYKEEVKKAKREVVLAGFLGLLIALPFFYVSLTPKGLARFRGTNVIAASVDRFKSEALLNAKAVEENDFLGKVIHNRRTVTARIILEGYASHFDPGWLFFNDSDEKHKVPSLGLLYVWEIPLIILGVIALFTMRSNRKAMSLLIAWFIIAPIPSAFATDAPHAMRSYTFLPAWQIISAIGFLSLRELCQGKLLRRLLSIFSGVILIASVVYFYKYYFIVFPKTQSSSFQYPLSKAINFVLENEKDYDRIIFSNKDNLYQSYMFFLFYSKYDSELYQKQGGTISGGFAEEHRFSRYEFRLIKWNQELPGDKILYISNRGEIPDGDETIAAFKNLDGRESIIASTR